MVTDIERVYMEVGVAPPLTVCCTIHGILTATAMTHEEASVIATAHLGVDDLPPPEDPWVVPWTLAACEERDRLIKAKKPFTTDLIWAELERKNVPPPNEPRIMGAVILHAVLTDRIIRTGKHPLTTRKVAHRRPVTEWIAAKRVGAILVPDEYPD